MKTYIIHDGALCSLDELRHYGVPGMKWGVRKKTNAHDKSVYKSLRKANRVNTRMEKYRSVLSGINKRQEAGKKSKNPFVKLYGASFVLDQKLTEARYTRAKKKVDSMLIDLEQRGVTLKSLKERKTGLTVSGGYDFISSWNGVRYELDR